MHAPNGLKELPQGGIEVKKSGGTRCKHEYEIIYIKKM